MPIIQKRNEFVEKFNGFDSVIDTDSVFKVIDFTKTYDGSKKLREIVRNPLYDINKLNDRYGNIDKIYNNREIFKTTDKLNKIANINRINRKRVLNGEDQRLNLEFRNLGIDDVVETEEVVGE